MPKADRFKKYDGNLWREKPSKTIKQKDTAYGWEAGAVTVGWEAVLGKYPGVLLRAAGVWIQDLALIQSCFSYVSNEMTGSRSASNLLILIQQWYCTNREH